MPHAPLLALRTTLPMRTRLARRRRHAEQSLEIHRLGQFGAVQPVRLLQHVGFLGRFSPHATLLDALSPGMADRLRPHAGRARMPVGPVSAQGIFVQDRLVGAAGRRRILAKSGVASPHLCRIDARRPPQTRLPGIPAPAGRQGRAEEFAVLWLAGARAEPRLRGLVSLRPPRRMLKVFRGASGDGSAGEWTCTTEG